MSKASSALDGSGASSSSSLVTPPTQRLSFSSSSFFALGSGARSAQPPGEKWRSSSEAGPPVPPSGVGARALSSGGLLASASSSAEEGSFPPEVAVGAIGQQRRDRALAIQWGAAAMQVAKADFEGTLVFGGRAQALPLRRFEHYRGKAVVAPLRHEAMDCLPVVFSALPGPWQAIEPDLVARPHGKLGALVLRWFVHHFNMREEQRQRR